MRQFTLGGLMLFVLVAALVSHVLRIAFGGPSPWEIWLCVTLGGVAAGIVIGYGFDRRTGATIGALIGGLVAFDCGVLLVTM